MPVNRYETMTEALADLRRRGFTDSFSVTDRKARSRDSHESIPPEEFEVIEFHRFEGPSSADDMSVVYALESRTGTRGTLVDAFGTYANAAIAEFLQQVGRHENR